MARRRGRDAAEKNRSAGQIEHSDSGKCPGMKQTEELCRNDAS